MSIRTTIFLLAVLVGMGVYFLLMEKNRTETIDPANESNERPLFTIDELWPAGIETVSIQWEKTKVELKQENSRWWQTQPVRFPLQSTRVSGIMFDTAKLKYIEKFLPGKDDKPTLAECGLENPRVVIRFIGEAKDTQIDRETGQSKTTTKPFDQTVHIGAGLTGSRGYVRLNDDPHVYVVNNTLHGVLLNEGIVNWRLRSLEIPSDAQAERIRMKLEDRTLELWKTKGGDWYFAAPLNDRVKAKAPAALLGLVKSVQIGHFLKEEETKNLATFGLDKPAIEVVVQTSAIEPKSRTLRIGSPADPSGVTHYATWSLGDEPSTVVFTVAGDVRGRLLAPRADELRDDRISLSKPAQLLEVSVKTPKGSVRLQRAPAAGWVFAPEDGQSAPPYKADQDAVGQLLEAVTTSTAKYFAAEAKVPAAPLATVELHSSGGKDAKEVIVFAKPPTDALPKGDDTPMVMAIRNNETTGYLVPEAALRPVFQPVSTLRDRQLVDLKPEQITAISIKRFDGVNYEFKRFTTAVDPTGKPQWQMVGASTFERDGLEQLLKFLSTLRAEAWLADEEELGKRTVELSISTEQGQYRIFTVDLDTRRGRIAGDKGTFLASGQTVLFLDAEYRPRTVLDLVPGSITQVTLKKGEAKPMTVGKDDLGRFFVLDPEGKPITTIKVDPQVAARLFDAITPLRAWRQTTKPEAPGEPMTTIEAVGRDLKKHVIQFGYKENPLLASVNDQWFTLTPETFGRLNAEPMKKDEKGK